MNFLVKFASGHDSEMITTVNAVCVQLNLKCQDLHAPQHSLLSLVVLHYRHIEFHTLALFQLIFYLFLFAFSTFILFWTKNLPFMGFEAKFQILEFNSLCLHLANNNDDDPFLSLIIVRRMPNKCIMVTRSIQFWIILNMNMCNQKARQFLTYDNENAIISCIFWACMRIKRHKNKSVFMPGT